jgi:hypothetical protein
MPRPLIGPATNFTCEPITVGATAVHGHCVPPAAGSISPAPARVASSLSRSGVLGRDVYRTCHPQRVRMYCASDRPGPAARNWARSASVTMIVTESRSRAIKFCLISEERPAISRPAENCRSFSGHDTPYQICSTTFATEPSAQRTCELKEVFGSAGRPASGTHQKRAAGVDQTTAMKHWPVIEAFLCDLCALARASTLHFLRLQPPAEGDAGKHLSQSRRSWESRTPQAKCLRHFLLRAGSRFASAEVGNLVIGRDFE